MRFLCAFPAWLSMLVVASGVVVHQIQIKSLQYSALRSNRFVAIVGTVSKTVVDQHRVKL